MPGPCFASRRLRHGAGALRHAAGALGSLAAARRVACMGALLTAWGGAWTASLVTAPARAEESSLPRRKPVKRSIEAFAPTLREDVETLPPRISPLIGSTREGCSDVEVP